MSRDLYEIAWRRKIIVNTDPQRRCYNGCNFSEEERWTNWATFGVYSKEDGESSIVTFKQINKGQEYELRQIPPKDVEAMIANGVLKPDVSL